MADESTKPVKIQAFAHLNVDPKTITLEDATEWVKANVKKGAICPCCDQLARRYQRKLSSSMAAALILIRRAFRKQSDWLHVPDYLSEVATEGAIVRGGDWAKLTHWKLIEAKPDETRKDGSRRVGLYRLRRAAWTSSSAVSRCPSTRTSTRSTSSASARR